MPLLPDDLSGVPKVSWDQKDIAIVLDPSMIPPEHDDNYPIIGGIAVSRISLGLAENTRKKINFASRNSDRHYLYTIFRVPYLRGNYSFLNFVFKYCDVCLQCIKVRKLFKGGNYSQKYGTKKCSTYRNASEFRLAKLTLLICFTRLLRN